MGAILCHTNISEVVSKYTPKPVRNLTLTPGKFLVSLTWEDPADYTEDGYTCAWVKTIVVRKQGGYPEDIHDGTVVVTTVERNKYKSDSYNDTGLTAGTTYYYKVFTCSSDGIYGESCSGSAVPIQYRIMTVELNLACSNPKNIGSYSDNAIKMPSGKTNDAVIAWQEFFGYRPCLFKSGKVVGYLNPNDYTKFEDGSAADITSGNAGDVMIEFPRRGVRISKSGKVVTVSMTDEPDNPDFKYYAHQRGSTNKDYFYLGAYFGTLYGNKVRSLSGKQAYTKAVLSTYYNNAVANGTGYGVLAFYQWTYIQAMYILQYAGNLNSISVHGRGTSTSSTYYSGRGDTAGVLTGGSEITDPNKLFGLEDFFGTLEHALNNFYCSSGRYVSTTTDDTITNGDKYTYQNYQADYQNNSGYISMCIGSSDLGFICENGHYTGSSSTYFCDFSDLHSDSTPAVGLNGMFYFSSWGTNRYANGDINPNIYSTRLQYL